MNLFALALALAALIGGNALAAPDAPDLHDPEAVFAAHQKTGHDDYLAVVARYVAEQDKAPEDVELGVALCQFVESFKDLDSIDFSDEVETDFDDCLKRLKSGWPNEPLARIYQIEHDPSQLTLANAAQTWKAAQEWPRELRARLAVQLNKAYEQEDEDKAGHYAVVAARLGSPDLVADAIRFLASEGRHKQALELAGKSAPATSREMAADRVFTLIKLDEGRAARRELDRSIAAGIELSAATRVRAYVADHDLKAANQAAKGLDSDDSSVQNIAKARFKLALANGQLDKARGMVAFDDGFDHWVSRYSEVVAKSPIHAFGLELLPFTLAILATLFSTALLPGVILVPVHYRGLARRLKNRAPKPLFEGIGIGHAWYAGAVAIIVPVLTVFAIRPDAIAAMFEPGEDVLATQMGLVAAGSFLSLACLSPWLRRLRMPSLDGRSVFRWQVGLVVVACWLVIYGSGVLSEFVHDALIGGDSSTLQTKTVEALVRGSTEQYGLFTTWLVIGLLTAILEETTFRGMFLGGMSRHISFGWANTLQAAAFASLHADPPRFVVYMLMGLFGGWLTPRYRSLLPAIALHLLNNTIATLSMS